MFRLFVNQVFPAVPQFRALPVTSSNGRMSPKTLIGKRYDAAIVLEIQSSRLPPQGVDVLLEVAVLTPNVPAMIALAEKYPESVTAVKVSHLMAKMDPLTRNEFANSVLEEKASGKIPKSLETIVSDVPTKGVTTVLAAPEETGAYLQRLGVYRSACTFWVHSGGKYDPKTVVFGGDEPRPINH